MPITASGKVICIIRPHDEKVKGTAPGMLTAHRMLVYISVALSSQCSGKHSHLLTVAGLLE